MLPPVSLAAGSMGTLVYLVIFPFLQSRSHIGVAVVLAKVACSVCWGRSCFGRTCTEWGVLGSLKETYKQNTVAKMVVGEGSSCFPGISDYLGQGHRQKWYLPALLFWYKS